MRSDGRQNNQIRPCTIQPGFIGQALGSALIATGTTRVICTASAESKPPPWLDGGGWLTAQYAMLPGATTPRGRRDPGGRGKEIQRLIGRSLRAAVDLSKMVGPQGPVSLVCDCDVIEADGGTRTASITGSYVALSIAVDRLLKDGLLTENPIVAPLAAVSVGLVRPHNGTDGAPAQPMLDLCYVEDSAAEVDLNVVMLQGGGLVEVQGTAEGGAFNRGQLNEMLDLAAVGIESLQKAQSQALQAAKR